MKLTYNDQQHAYWLDKKRCKSVTAVAKIPDDTFRLNQWQKRQVAIGLAATPALVERVTAHFDDRDAMDAICEEAMTAAKSHDKAERGTAWHRITERVDLAEEMIETDQSRAIRAAWTKALDAAGLEVVPDYVERIIVYPDLLLCGKFDRIFRRRSDGAYVIGDLKTGQRAVEYPHSIAVQLAIYANAPLLAGDIGGQSGSTEHFEPLPEPFDRDLGYVIHMPDPEHVEVVGVDIAQGWRVARDACFPVVEWRKVKSADLIFPLPAVSLKGEPTDGKSDHEPAAGGPVRTAGSPERPGGSAEGRDASGAGSLGRDGGAAAVDRSDNQAGSSADDRSARKAEQARSRTAVERPGADEHHAVPAEARYQWLRARLQTLVDAGHGPECVHRWPTGTPKLKTFDHTDEQLDEIGRLLERIEAAHQIPFGPGLRDFYQADDGLPANPEFDVDPDPVETVKDVFPGAVEIAGGDTKKPYANWLRQITARDPSAGDRIVADLKAVGLQKSLSRDEWTPDELRTLDGILRRAERAITAPTHSSTQQQLAS